MKCQSCGQHDAVNYIRMEINGRSCEMCLCPECYAKMQAKMQPYFESQLAKIGSALGSFGRLSSLMNRETNPLWGSGLGQSVDWLEAMQEQIETWLGDGSHLDRALPEDEDQALMQRISDLGSAETLDQEAEAQKQHGALETEQDKTAAQDAHEACEACEEHEACEEAYHLSVLLEEEELKSFLSALAPSARLSFLKGQACLAQEQGRSDLKACIEKMIEALQ